jgi:hypothetical protein
MHATYSMLLAQGLEQSKWYLPKYVALGSREIIIIIIITINNSILPLCLFMLITEVLAGCCDASSMMHNTHVRSGKGTLRGKKR